MGDFLNGKSSTSQTATSNPWATQVPYLQQGFDQAKANLEQGQSIGPYTGSYYSPDNSIQTGGANQANNFTSTAGASLPYTTAGTAATLQSGAYPYLSNASNLASNGAGNVDPALMGVLSGYATGAKSPGGTSAPLSSALESSALSGLSSLSNGTNTLQQAAGQSLSDPTQQNIADAGAYASNPAVKQAIDAATQPVNQVLNEQTLPGLNRAESLNGNLNSSRAAISEALAKRDTAQTDANIAGQISSNAYSNGLSLAAQQREAGINSAIGAGTAQGNLGSSTALGTAASQLANGQFTTGTQLGAANSAIGNELSNLGLNASTKLSANGQLGSGAEAGVNAATAATGQAGSNLANAEAAGGVLQTDQNAQLADAYQRQMSPINFNAGLLNNYWGITGSNNWGNQTTGTQTTTSSPSILGAILGTAATGASIAKGM